MRRDCIYISRFSSPLGEMIAAAVEDGVCLLEFNDRTELKKEIQFLQQKLGKSIVEGSHPHLDRLKKELYEYFKGKRKAFTVPIFPEGTEFQKKVWTLLGQIPYGATKTYKDQAIAAGNLKAIRAVARANGQNKIAILIPCHRVIGSNGTLTGYAGGLWRKQKLLELENPTIV